MALNLKTLGTRSISAAVFVVLLLGSLLWNYYSFAVFFFIVSMIGLHEFYKIAEKLNARPYKIVGFICGAFVYLSFIYISNLPYGLVLVPFIILCAALFSKREMPVQNAVYTFAGLLYAVLPFALLQGMVVRWNPNITGALEFYPYILFGVILLIWSNDTFAYLGGSLFGKNKMIERISPGKTWEGTIFGVIVTFGISFLIRTYLVKDDTALWPILGIVIPVLATVGDLVESMLKRQAGIKDSGTIMPGHGGILDRFDSLIFVAPFVFVIMKLL